MASEIWLRTILIVREETRCCHIDYSFRLAARVLLYAPSHRQDSTYYSLCYTIRGALAGTRNSSMGPPHEGSIRQPIASWANTLTMELHLAPWYWSCPSHHVLIVEEMHDPGRPLSHGDEVVWRAQQFEQGQGSALFDSVNRVPGDEQTNNNNNIITMKCTS